MFDLVITRKTAVASKSGKPEARDCYDCGHDDHGHGGYGYEVVRTEQ